MPENKQQYPSRIGQHLSYLRVPIKLSNYIEESKDGRTIAVWFALCRYAQSFGRAFPSVATIAEELGYSSKTSVHEGIRKLKDLGVLLVIQRWRLSDDSQLSSCYWLMFDNTLPSEDEIAQLAGEGTRYEYGGDTSSEYGGDTSSEYPNKELKINKELNLEKKEIILQAGTPQDSSFQSEEDSLSAKDKPLPAPKKEKSEKQRTHDEMVEAIKDVFYPFISNLSKRTLGLIHKCAKEYVEEGLRPSEISLLRDLALSQYKEAKYVTMNSVLTFVPELRKDQSKAEISVSSGAWSQVDYGEYGSWINRGIEDPIN